MKIKKLLAGVVAAALTATSFVAANVSAAPGDVKVFDFTSQENWLTFTAVHKLTALANKNLNHVLDTSTSDTYRFKLSLTGAKVGGEALIAEGLVPTSAAKITVSGVDKNGVAKKVDTTTFRDKDGNEAFYAVGGEGKVFLDDHELDLAAFGEKKDEDAEGEEIKTGEIFEITIEQSFKMPSKAIIDGSVVFVSVDENATSFTLTGDIQADTNKNNQYKEIFYKAELDGTLTSEKKSITATKCKNNVYTNPGIPVVVDRPVTLDPTNTNMIGQGWSIDLVNLLAAINDTIGTSSGATIAIKFAPVSQQGSSTSGMTVLGSSNAGNEAGSWPWWVSGESSSSSSSTKKDVVFAVNARSSKILRQDVYLDENCVATFSWDELIKNSPSTVAGNVSSLSFFIDPNGDNAKEIVREGGFVDEWGNAVNGAIISSITVSVPKDQSGNNQGGNQGGNNNSDDRAVILEGGQGDTSVSVIGTVNTLFGNGAEKLQVISNITGNKIDYTLKLTDASGEKYYQPAGEVTLKLSIPSAFQGQTLKSDKVTHTCNDGTVEELAIQNFSTYKTDKFITVKTSKFSSFGFEFEGSNEDGNGDATSAPETQAPETQAPVTTEAAGNVQQPTNDKTTPATGFAIAIVPAAIAAAAAVVAKKRK